MSQPRSFCRLNLSRSPKFTPYPLNRHCFRLVFCFLLTMLVGSYYRVRFSCVQLKVYIHPTLVLSLLTVCLNLDYLENYCHPFNTDFHSVIYNGHLHQKDLCVILEVKMDQKEHMCIICERLEIGYKYFAGRLVDS